MLWGVNLAAQPGFFGLGQQWLSLSPQPQQWLVTFDGPQPSAGWSQLAHPELETAWATHPTQSRHLMLRWHQPRSLETDALWSLHQLGLDTSQVAVIDPAYALPDGHLVGLLPQLALKLQGNLDTTLVHDLIRQRPEVDRLEPLLNGVLRIHLQNLGELWHIQDWLWQNNWPVWCQPDFLVRLIPADPYSGSQFFLHNTGQIVDGWTATVDIDVDAPEAWALEQGDSSVIVAIYDNGLEAHEDLETPAGTSRVLLGFSLIGGSNGAPLFNLESHGMGCVGLIAASHNGLGVQGIAPGVSLLPIYTPFSLMVPIADIANGLTWAWQVGGADVINCSWALPTCDTTGYPVLVQAIRDALTFGRGGYGTVLVFAAGNDTLNCVRFPAMMDSTIGVGAIDLQGNPSVYANRGLALDVVAPSSGLNNNVRTIDRVGSNGVNVNGTNDLSNLNYTRNFGGTSSATALSTGVVGLLLSAYPNLMAYEVQQILRDGADDMGPPGLDADYGYGRLNAFASLNEASAYGPLAQPDWQLEAQSSEEGIHLRWQPMPTGGELVLERRNQQGARELTHWTETAPPAQFTDLSPASGWNLYRLTWLTPRGEQQVSRWVRVNWTPPARDWFVGWSRTPTGWRWPLSSHWTDGELRLHDLQGRELLHRRIQGQAGEWISIEAPRGAGLYVVQLRDQMGRRQWRRVVW